MIRTHLALPPDFLVAAGYYLLRSIVSVLGWVPLFGALVQEAELWFRLGPVSNFKRSQAKHVKKPYRVSNWPQYEAGLRQRGSLTVWLGLEPGQTTVPGWAPPADRKLKRGGQQLYSDHAIETAVTLGMVFNLPTRQTEGFLRSLFALLDLANEVPDHTTICRRMAKLGKVPLNARQSRRPVHILIDSSGLRVQVGQLRKPPKNRDYRKIHLAVDAVSGDVLACELGSKSARDPARVPALLAQIDRPISSAKADAAYDTSGVYDAIASHTEGYSPRVVIPPKKGAVLGPASATTQERNRNIRSRARHGKRGWQRSSGYNRRSLVESTFSRYKRIIGPAMRARRLATQRVEARLGCKLLNRMSALGMPDGRMIG